jgi:hypothetical protein
MKDFFQYRESLTEARKKPARDSKKKEIKKGWVAEPKRGDASITRLFNKLVNPEKKIGEGYMVNGMDDLISFYAKEAIEDGDFEDYVDPDDVDDKYVEDGEIDFYKLEKNRRDWKSFLEDFESSFSDQQWGNVRNDLRSSKSSDLHVIDSKNTSKPTKITVAEGGGYFTGSGSHEVYYIHIGNDVDFEDPDLVLMSKKYHDTKKVAQTIERMLFDGHKSVKKIKI